MTLETVPRPSQLPGEETTPLGRRIAFFNNKGGVGKTLITIEIGAALARRGRRVLLVDMDPQGNLSRRTGAHLHTDFALDMAYCLQLREKGGAAQAIRRTGWPIPEANQVQVIASSLDLQERENEAAQPGSHKRLARVLYGLTDAYDYTLFDCRPNLGHLEQMVVAALDGEDDGYYLVAQPEADAISGAYRVREKISGWAADMDMEGLDALGVIVNLHDGYKLHKGRSAALSESLTPEDGDAPPILQPYIPRAVRLAQLHDLGRPSTGDQRLIAEGHLARFDALAEQIDAQS